MIRVHAGGETLVIGDIRRHNTILTVIAERSVECGFIISAAETQIVILHQGVVVKDGTLPVGTLTELVGIGIGYRLASRLCGFVAQEGIVAGIQEVELVGSRLRGKVTVEIYLQCSAFSFFGSYEDDTAGRFGTIDGSGGSILENFN